MLLAMLAGAIGIPRHHHDGIAPTPHDVDKMLDRMDRALGRIAALEADNKELKSEVEMLKLERSEIGLRLERKTSQNGLVLRQQELRQQELLERLTTDMTRLRRDFCRHVEICAELANIEPVQNIDHLMR